MIRRKRLKEISKWMMKISATGGTIIEPLSESVVCRNKKGNFIRLMLQKNELITLLVYSPFDKRQNFLNPDVPATTLLSEIMDLTAYGVKKALKAWAE